MLSKIYFVSDAANSAWSKEGVTTVSVDEDEQMRVYDIVCESSHFTAFAVLMDVTGALNVSLMQRILIYLNQFFIIMLGLLERNYRNQVCSIGGDLCWLFHLHLLSSVVYLLFLDIEVIIEALHMYKTLLAIDI